MSLTKLVLPQSLGVYSDGRTVHVALVAAVPWSSWPLRQVRVPIDEGDEAAAISEAFRLLGSGVAGLPAVLGVSTDRCYFATRPVSVSTDVLPSTLLRESLRAGSAGCERLVADTVRSRPDSRDTVSIAACDRQWLQGQFDGLASSRVRLAAAEPAVCGLLRLAETNAPRRGKEQLVIRVFLSDGEALAVLAHQGQPVLWRSAALGRADEAATILALVRSLVSVAKPCGVQRQPGAVIVSGRNDLRRLVDVPWLCENLMLPFRWQDGPALHGDQIAHGLALRALQDGSAGLDFARTDRRPPPLWQSVPWRDAIVYAAAVLLMAVTLNWHEQQLLSATARAQRAADQLVPPELATSELQNLRRDLEARTTAVKRFLDSRTLWSAQLRELSDSLPDNVYLTSLQGDAELETRRGGRAAKRSLVLKGAAELPANGTVPHEVNGLVETIRSRPSITGDFQVVELVDLKRFRRVEDDRELAMFTIVCMPKTTRSGR